MNTPPPMTVQDLVESLKHLRPTDKVYIHSTMCTTALRHPPKEADMGDVIGRVVLIGRQ